MGIHETQLVTGQYGVQESNGITGEVRAVREAIEETVNLTDRRLARITRLRLVTDPGFPAYDVSYCYGELKTGEPVRVRLPHGQFPKRNLTGALIEMCKDAGVYAKGLGLLDPANVSIMAG